MSERFEDLKQLAGMLERGEITRDEYDRLKADLLSETDETPAKGTHSGSHSAQPDSSHPAPPTSATPTMGNQTRWWVIGTGVLIAIGSFLPWARAGIFTLSGIDGDGALTLVAGAVVALIGVSNRANPATALGIIVMAGTSLLIVVNVIGNFGVGDADSMGSGLFITLVASFVAVFAGIQVFREARHA